MLLTFVAVTESGTLISYAVPVADVAAMMDIRRGGYSSHSTEVAMVKEHQGCNLMRTTDDKKTNYYKAADTFDELTAKWREALKELESARGPVKPMSLPKDSPSAPAPQG